MQYLDIACRLLIGTVFAVAAVSKVSGRAAFDAFRISLRQMGVIPAGWADRAARVTPIVETAAVVLIALPWRGTVAAGFTVAAGLLTVFAVAIGVVVHRGERVACRCFGASAAPLTRRHIARNVALIAMCAVGVVGVVSPSGSVRLAGALVAGFAGLVAGTLVTVLDDIVALFAPSAR